MERWSARSYALLSKHATARDPQPRPAHRGAHRRDGAHRDPGSCGESKPHPVNLERCLRRAVGGWGPRREHGPSEGRRQGEERARARGRCHVVGHYRFDDDRGG